LGSPADGRRTGWQFVADLEQDFQRADRVDADVARWPVLRAQR